VLAQLERATTRGGIEQVDGQAIAGSLSALPEIIGRSGMRRPMLLVDRRAVSAAGLAHDLRAAFGAGVGAYDNIQPNPTYELAVDALGVARQMGADGLVAIGGGSCIDLAKAVAVGLCHVVGLERVGASDWAVLHAAPLVAAPTTAGSGSQATSFGVLYKDGKKLSLEHPTLRPCGVVLDARFIEALPPKLSAASAMDALCQCVESIWACRATEASASVAREGGRLMASNAAAAVLRRDPVACRAIMLGAHLSGCAINTSRTTAAHAFSYGLTQRFGVPHGLAVALSLGWVSSWNAAVDAASCCHPGGESVARAAVREAASVLNAPPEAVGDAIASLLAELGLPATMAQAGIPREALGSLAESMDPLRSSNNPRRLLSEDVAWAVERWCELE
jgi:alcohol dehydrogenase class IV